MVIFHRGLVVQSKSVWTWSIKSACLKAHILLYICTKENVCPGDCISQRRIAPPSPLDHFSPGKLWNPQKGVRARVKEPTSPTQQDKVRIPGRRFPCGHYALMSHIKRSLIRVCILHSNRIEKGLKADRKETHKVYLQGKTSHSLNQ